MPIVMGIDDESAEFQELPETVQKALRASQAEADKNAQLEERLAKLEGVKKEEEPPPQNQPVQNKWGMNAEQEMSYNTRSDVILMRLLQGNDKQTAAAIRLFEPEILDALKNSHPAHRAQEKYVENIVNLVKGRHLSEITADIRANGGKFDAFVESPTGGNPPPPVIDPVSQLTPEEARAADKWGVPRDKFAARLKEVRG
jgi:hypothetical protein